jgi:hypothetical protein
VGSDIIFINGASSCNVFWQVNGAVDLGENSIFSGTIVASGAITLLDGAELYGRALTTAGAIALHSNIVAADPQPMASTLTANGPTTFCSGGSVVISGNVGGVFNTGETTASITVTTSGDYFVTNTDACGSVMSNVITVTVNPEPACAITGDDIICEGGSTELCASPGAASYLWDTGATTNCISADEPGKYFVTVTNSSGCSSICSKEVILEPEPVCQITGDGFLCEPGQSTELCVPAGASSYLWSTGATTNCISVDQAGTYSVTVTNSSGCSSICSKEIGRASCRERV